MTDPMKVECMYVCNSVYILSFMASCGPVSCGYDISLRKQNKSGSGLAFVPPLLRLLYILLYIVVDICRLLYII